MEMQWEVQKPDPDLVRKLAQDLKCGDIIATVLANRGIPSGAEARRFINAPMSDMASPFDLGEMEVAVQRVHRALVKQDKILLFGDYDTDGITATAVLAEFLTTCGAAVTHYIPHRMAEGYGLQPHQITGHALPRQTDLIITADCGSASFDAIAAANNAGIDVIVTDHHIPPEPTPPAMAMINPKTGKGGNTLGMLAGVGVAFYLVIALRTHLRRHRFWAHGHEPNLKNLCDLVALGTIADQVPMVGTNRILTRMGLSLLNSRTRPGIRALMDISGMTGRNATAEDVAFRLAPRLNAAGRLTHADDAYRLLTARDPGTAIGMAEKLDRLNRQRREIEASMFDEIVELLENAPDLLDRGSIVQWKSGWHEGVIGIVASRLVNRYHRPVVLISMKGETGKGSGRSTPDVDLHGAISECSGDLVGFGGHAMAAGITITRDNLTRFARRFEEVVASRTEPEPSPPPLSIDCILGFEAITASLIDRIEHLMPFGMDNDEPLFMATNVTVTKAQIVGGSHRRMRLGQATPRGTIEFGAIQFNVDPAAKPPAFHERIAFRLRWNRWNGTQSPQLMIEAT